MIDNINKILFVHIPRTGGSQFSNFYHKEVLSPAVDLSLYERYFAHGDFNAKHFRYQDYEILVGAGLVDYKTVTGVRNIYDLAVSTWRMSLLVNGEEVLWGTGDRKNTFVNFLDWLSIQKESRLPIFSANGIVPYQSMRQKEYLKGCKNCEVIRYEDYDKGVRNFFLNHFSLETGLKKYTDEELKLSDKYRGRKLDYREYYTGETKQKVESLFAEDIEHFNFQFDT